jgi:hypothetical protein
VRHASPRWEAQAAGQYVQFGNLPERAFGTGPLGTGGAYYDASHDTASRQLYLKYLNLKLKDVVTGLDLQAGRLGYTSGAEMFSVYTQMNLHDVFVQVLAKPTRNGRAPGSARREPRERA